MNVRSCKGCGRLFNYITGATLCPACREAMEAKFQVVKEYIREHKGAGIQEVSEQCDVPTAQIRQWLREERLEVTENSAMFLNCEFCGAPIRCGKYCDKCKTSMTQGFNRVLQGNKPVQEDKGTNKDANARMRFL